MTRSIELDDLRRTLEHAVDEEELLQLVRDLVAIPSHWALEEREEPISNHIKQLFEQEGIEVYQQFVVNNRPNVIATLRGTGEGKSIMFNGHIDTVPPFGMMEPFSAKVENGQLHGRGSADMKSGVGAMAYALILLKRLGIRLKGDVVFAGVIDEDAAGSAGTRYLVDNGPKTDYAIVGEPTLLHPVTAHKGIDYFEIIFRGKSVHSSVPDNGVNAIYAAADFIRKVERELIPAYKTLIHPLVGAPTVNVGLVQGCAQGNMPFLMKTSPTFAGTVPDMCRVYIDIRWTPDQTLDQITNDVEKLAQQVHLERSDVSVEVHYIPLPRPAMEIEKTNPLVQILQRNIADVMGTEFPVRGETYWGDSGLLYGAAGIPTLLFGPGDIGCAHSDHETIDISQLAPAALLYALTAIDICGLDQGGDSV